MTKSLADHLGREFDEHVPAELATAAHREEVSSEPMERLRLTVLSLIAALPRQPRTVRMRAGDMSVEVEWVPEIADGRVIAEPGAAAEPSSAAVARFLTSPMVGVFYRAPAPGAPPFVDAGDTVVVGQQVGIVEAMKLLIPVEADLAGVVSEALKADGEPVEFLEPLFVLDAE